MLFLTSCPVSFQRCLSLGALVPRGFHPLQDLVLAMTHSPGPLIHSFLVLFPQLQSSPPPRMLPTLPAPVACSFCPRHEASGKGSSPSLFIQESPCGQLPIYSALRLRGWMKVEKKQNHSNWSHLTFVITHLQQLHRSPTLLSDTFNPSFSNPTSASFSRDTCTCACLGSAFPAQLQVAMAPALLRACPLATRRSQPHPKQGCSFLSITSIVPAELFPPVYQQAVIASIPKPQCSLQLPFYQTEVVFTHLSVSLLLLFKPTSLKPHPQHPSTRRSSAVTLSHSGAKANGPFPCFALRGFPAAFDMAERTSSLKPGPQVTPSTLLCPTHSPGSLLT